MLSKSTSVCRFVCSPARVFVWGAVWVLIMDACRQTMSSSFLFWSVCLWYNSALEPISPLRRWQGPSDRARVCMCVLHTCMWGEGGGVSPKNGKQHAGIIHETLQGKGWRCFGRGLFDKQTCYPIRWCRSVWWEEPGHHRYPVAMKQMGLIDTRGGGTHARVPSGFYEA